MAECLQGSGTKTNTGLSVQPWARCHVIYTFSKGELILRHLSTPQIGAYINLAQQTDSPSSLATLRAGIWETGEKRGFPALSPTACRGWPEALPTPGVMLPQPRDRFEVGTGCLHTPLPPPPPAPGTGPAAKKPQERLSSTKGSQREFQEKLTGENKTPWGTFFFRGGGGGWVGRAEAAFHGHTPPPGSQGCSGVSEKERVESGSAKEETAKIGKRSGGSHPAPRSPNPLPPCL